MKHRIVVLGAGYAGAHTAGRLARRLHPADTEITLVNAEPDFVERVRLHQLAAGQDLPPRPLRDVFAGTHITLRHDRVSAVDPDRKSVTLSESEIEYDTLVYALGSTVTGHGHHVASRPAALALRGRLDDLGAGATVLVVGGGLTGIETATELAESRPDLQIAIAARGDAGDWLGDKARVHLRSALDRLGITVHERADIAGVDDRGGLTDTGRLIPAAVTVWTGGFATYPIAAASGLAVAGNGQVVVDGTMRSVSHPDVYAVGDTAYAEGAGGKPLRMSCASGIPTAWQAADSIVARLAGGDLPTTPLRYFNQCISLGRRDGIIQFVTADDRAKATAITGRPAARIKEFICAGAAWSVGHPTVMMPTRRRHTSADLTTAGSSAR
ncbi:NAD(P)/FAD-dependent oxidoreductase [Actinoplanes solisilvae]|uniref:NAD(P)/FAD-dependent oxidoreductase n=1 Tax=Actinoplanes solisilvae TaxID=2486853 RepID=UPI000FDC3D24|nr:FAD-dependent oxidoreductase [Actinoplanes solisilvae]